LVESFYQETIVLHQNSQDGRSESTRFRIPKIPFSPLIRKSWE